MFDNKVEEIEWVRKSTEDLHIALICSYLLELEERVKKLEEMIPGWGS